MSLSKTALSSSMLQVFGWQKYLLCIGIMRVQFPLGFQVIPPSAFSPAEKPMTFNLLATIYFISNHHVNPALPIISKLLALVTWRTSPLVVCYVWLHPGSFLGKSCYLPLSVTPMPVQFDSSEPINSKDEKVSY